MGGFCSSSRCGYSGQYKFYPRIPAICLIGAEYPGQGPHFTLCGECRDKLLNGKLMLLGMGATMLYVRAEHIGGDRYRFGVQEVLH